MPAGEARESEGLRAPSSPQRLHRPYLQRYAVAGREDAGGLALPNPYIITSYRKVFQPLKPTAADSLLVISHIYTPLRLSLKVSHRLENE